MNSAIQVDGLKKSYGDHFVLKGLTFQIAKGETFALLGVNGAGKTTALECMEGLRSYDSGSITCNGRTGIQLQSASLPAHIKPMEAVRLFSKWNRTPINSVMLAALGISELGTTEYQGLSTGQKRRLHLALALISDPDILFLDEPTAGLDVEGRHALHDQIRGLKAQGKTILLASHDMTEVENLCDRMAILQAGHIAFLGTLAELTARVGKRYTLYIETADGKTRVKTAFVGDTLLTLLEDYKKRNVAVFDIQIEHGTLEQSFIEIAKGTDI